MDAATMCQLAHRALKELGTDCPMEEVLGLCPDLTWNQVFLALDYSSRSGHVRVMVDPRRTYRMQALQSPVSISSIQ